MTAPASRAPFEIVSVLNHAIDAVLGGSGGWFRIPRGGYVNVTWLSRKQAYRITIDLTAGHELSSEAAAFLAELAERIAQTPRMAS